jgi:hypothetical protein
LALEFRIFRFIERRRWREVHGQRDRYSDRAGDDPIHHYDLPLLAARRLAQRKLIGSENTPN